LFSRQHFYQRLPSLIFHIPLPPSTTGLPRTMNLGPPPAFQVRARHPGREWGYVCLEQKRHGVFAEGIDLHAGIKNRHGPRARVCPIQSHMDLSCLVMPCPALPCPVRSCHGMSFPALSQGPRLISVVTNGSLRKGPSSRLQLTRAPAAFCSGGVETRGWSNSGN
jgi:hypothetical protein